MKVYVAEELRRIAIAEGRPASGWRTVPIIDPRVLKKVR